MKKFKKTALAVVLALAMLIPSISFAADPNQAKIGDTEYATFEAALVAAKDGDTITLLDNVEITGGPTSNIAINKNVILDLNGKNFIRSNNTGTLNSRGGLTSAFIIENGKLTVRDSVGSGRVICRGDNAEFQVIRLKPGAGQKAEFILESGTIYGDNGTYLNAGVCISGNGAPGTGVFTMTGGKIDMTTCKGDTYGADGNGNNGRQGTIINIRGGVIDSSDIGIYQPQSGVLNISGGTINGVGIGIGMKRGTLNMTGGTVNATGQKKDPVYSGNGINPTGAALQIESNKTYNTAAYPGVIQINISGTKTKLNSVNADAVLEYATNGSKNIVDGFTLKDATIKGNIVLTDTVLGLSEDKLLIDNVKSASKPQNVGNDFVAVEQEDGTFVIVQKRYMSQVTGTGDFDELIVGYTNAPKKDFTVTNKGNNALKNLKAALKGKNAADFELTTIDPVGDLAVEKSASFSVKPKTGLKAGYYNATIVVSADKMDNKEIPVSILIAENTYFARVSGSGSLGEVTAGYTNAPKKDFTITNTGNSSLENLKASLTGANPASFQLTAIEPVGDLAVGSTASFSMQAKTGLKAGYYSATIVISADGMDDMEIPVFMGVKAVTDEPSIDKPNVDEPNIEKPGSDVTVTNPNAPIFVEQTKTEAKKDEVTAPKTGDNAVKMLLAVVAMSTAAVGIIAFGVLKKKAHNK